MKIIIIITNKYNVTVTNRQNRLAVGSKSFCC